MWQSTFVLRVFSANLNFIQGAVNIPELVDHNYTPRAALTLSTVVVQHCWGAETSHLLKATKLIPTKDWEIIIAEAQKYCKETTHKNNGDDSEDDKDEDNGDESDDVEDEYTDLFAY
ncbi:hypothetical protein BV22DRAFT_1052027 [Leucogyrophana mollusca]|uniref:Uncharacterized protein n=1 Tax=Leucogyrophana mollusca TaxID=85980 RepID=A0ACB8AWT2_9AGAM|nr:hypothetical protein BV22DRAFT_1052027 [Leucogyrophana mollusca]